jgi:hypothetical protein
VVSDTTPPTDRDEHPERNTGTATGNALDEAVSLLADDATKGEIDDAGIEPPDEPTPWLLDAAAGASIDPPIEVPVNDGTNGQKSEPSFEARRLEVIAAGAADPLLRPDTREILRGALPATDSDQPPAPGRSEAAGDRSPLAIRDVVEVANTLTGRRPFAFGGLMPASTYGVIAAAAKGGKGFTALDAAICTALDLPLFGHFPCGQPGRAIYFHAEDSNATVVRRVRAIVASHGRDFEELRGKLSTCPVVPRLGDAGVAAIREELLREAAVLVVVDPLYRAAPAAKGQDLYSWGPLWDAIAALCDETDVTFALAHHFNRNREAKGHERMTGAGPAEGARFLIGFEIVKRERSEHPEGQRRVLCFETEGSEIPDLTFKLRREIWADDPLDLNSPLHYEVEWLGAEDERDGSDGDGWRPTELMHRISRALTEFGPLTKNGIRQRVSGRNNWKDDALRCLVDEGYVVVEPGPNRAQLHRVVRPFEGGNDA